MLNSKNFYDSFSVSYKEYAKKKKEYLDSINKYIISNCFSGKTLLDLGAGNGERTKFIAQSLGVHDVTLVDQSEYMLNNGILDVKYKIINSDFLYVELGDKKFDIILCLWNVLGHVESKDIKLFFDKAESLISKDGVLFLDVNNRYNVKQYGFKNVLKNIIKDLFKRESSNGDFNLEINNDENKLKTRVHIFSPFELDKKINNGPLKIIDKKYVNYSTGNISSNPFTGQMLYKISKK